MTATELVGEGRPDPIEEPGSPLLLAFHGFTATPRELDPLADVARELGMGVEVPLFPGHGTHSTELAGVRFDDYSECGRAALAKVLRRNPDEKIVTGGLSTGALVAMQLAAEAPRNVVGLIALANALTLYSPYPAWPLRVLSHVRGVDFSVPKRNGPDLADPQARARHLMYPVQPARAASEVERAGRTVQGVLGRIRCPVFVAHGREDHVCPVDNAWRLADAVGTNDVEVLILERSWHILTEDFDRPELLRRAKRFLARVTKAPQRPVEP